MDSGGTKVARPTLQAALKRGFMGRCPNCGQGKLYRAYLTQVENCAECGERFGDIESDDAAPWFTILLASIAAAPLYFLFQSLLASHFVVTMILLVLIVIVLILVLLPRVKGVLLSAFWLSRLDRGTSG
ncbi:DUF983 domain-containing protein [Mesorhizobium sp. PAMC28654]|uniref:DUF983 domain-containing protein n=1 Tax=Mesorhizobium sp. PAMC28654 TaxID=2880934 RepID=UPI001D0AC6EC|nr:DUF983 domain-containing protein [Mesorhizobium sp. PAMC28654]UDL90679.1 DUF983 domain-containing protein [Mesorhizobium sp. PAMC28654]